ncbi:MAG: prepilin-type N-terminal cleavage/methylation domain-containing protein [Verrucomicrobia bacterium]|nr:prepilin-type N-terminal cleavage/methylation domain-containing protein [Verrucomicrobiota bacterium]
MQLQNSRSKAVSSGFTLIELMVAMAITVLILTVLISIISVGTDALTRSTSKIRAARQAKVFIDTMAKDFESLVTRPGNNFEWLHGEIDAAANLPKVTRNQAGQSKAAALTFMTAATDRYLGQIGGPSDGGGDVSCVSYRLRYQDPIVGGTTQDTSTFVLYRLLVDPNETFQKLLGQNDLKAAFQPFVDRSTERQNFICENVHQFTITLLVEIMREEPAGSGTMVPRTVRVTLSSDAPGSKMVVTGSGLQTNQTICNVTGVTPGQLAAGRLRAVEISISVLSDAAIVRRNAVDGLSNMDYSSNAFHYSRVVKVPEL